MLIGERVPLNGQCALQEKDGGFLMRAGIAAMLRARTRGGRRGLRVLAAGSAAAALALIAAACGPVSASSSAVGTTPVSGGTATYATIPGFPVNYIFPMDGISYFNVTNSSDFQYLMYRPLYWFGNGSYPLLNPALSLAEPPVYSGQQVTIKLKNYKWSDGRQVTAQDVIFWINMMRAVDHTGGWGGYVSGDFPDDVKNVHADGLTTVVMTIKTGFTPAWFTDNELSQITPMPQAWDKTSASTQGNCVNVVSACAAVYNYLNSQSVPTTMDKWASSKLWSVVDGPWKVIAASNSGIVTLGLNAAYSGDLPAHHISRFEIKPFTSEQSEFNVLQDPQLNQRVDVGYLPTVDAPVPAPGKSNGGNPISLAGYNLTVLYPWQLTYFPYNYTNPTVGPIFKQQYFREAFQSLVDQEGVINGPLHGYGKPTIGPVSDTPATTYFSPQLEQAGDRWPLSPGYAVNLLRSHGWTINTSGGVDTCARAGSGKNQCGPGIKAGAQLSFTLNFASGIDWMYSGAKELVSNASLVGIHIQLIEQDAGTVIQTAFCTPSPQCDSSWELAQWGSWSFAPDYLPTGEELFEATSLSDAGAYNDPHNNALITKTLTAKSQADFVQAMHTWQDYLSAQLPVVYEPNVPTLIETVRNLNIGVQSPTLNINPEDWYYLK